MVQPRSDKPARTPKSQGKSQERSRPVKSAQKQRPLTGTISPKKQPTKTFKIDEDASDRIEQILAQLHPNDVSEFKGMNRPSAGAL